ncbi:MAG: hypothetical protein KBT88_03390 [Gammaproteobacteria bacterium]|nr:hypothetical protein [Gammaproteobacteria bacterium]MBQ0838804.1 hypothetical protein [Gammaproteobacteria bacterium]
MYLCSFFSPLSLLADGSVVSKIYHPYVQPLEKEIELRTLYEKDDNNNDQQKVKLGYGQSLSDSWFGEIYLIAHKDGGDAFAIEAYEAELKWQITEQGEYAADWGLLFELEKEEGDAWEAASTLLVEHQWGRLIGAANLSAIYEWGDKIDDELESKLALQMRYRHSPRFEPAIEFFSGQDYKGIGPLIMGREILGPARRLRWELGASFAISSDSPDLTIKTALEYEF